MHKKMGHSTIRATQAVRITVRPVRVLKYINKYIYKILKHALGKESDLSIFLWFQCEIYL